MNNQFIDWLQSRQFSKPLTEAVQTLYEGLTKADVDLGKYLKGFDNGVKVPQPTRELPNEERMRYSVLARHNTLVADLLDAGSQYGDKYDDDFDDMAAWRNLISIVKGGMSDMKKDADVTAATGDMNYAFTECKRKQELKEAADMYRSGRSDIGYDKLSDVLGYNFEVFANAIMKLWSDQDYTDASNLAVAPGAKNAVVRNKWLMHETSLEAGLNIIRTGFDRGSSFGHLAWTDRNNNQYRGDYLFAHDVDDMLTHDANYDNGRTCRMRLYGYFMLVFRASGYKVYHYGDDDMQVLFDYHEPKAFFFVLRSDDAEKCNLPFKKVSESDLTNSVYGRGKNGSPVILYTNPNAENCLKWILAHGDDYRNMMFAV